MSNDLIKERYKKLEAIQAMGVDPFGGRFPKQGLIAELLKNFEDHKKVRTAGRLSGSLKLI